GLPRGTARSWSHADQDPAQSGSLNTVDAPEGGDRRTPRLSDLEGARRSSVSSVRVSTTAGAAARTVSLVAGLASVMTRSAPVLAVLKPAALPWTLTVTSRLSVALLREKLSPLGSASLIRFNGGADVPATAMIDNRG